MIWNKHLKLKGSHAVFSASQSAWLRYDEEKLIETMNSKYRKDIGTEIHDFAASQIILRHRFNSVKNLKSNLETYIYRKYFTPDLDEVSEQGIKILKSINYLSKEILETVKNYINDGIGYRMIPEQLLYYSEYFYGTADTISFNNNFLRIHDLKTGSLSVKIEQLMIYAALFCLEYKIDPNDISIELRIYQNAEIVWLEPDKEEIIAIMKKIIFNNKTLESFEKED